MANINKVSMFYSEHRVHYVGFICALHLPRCGVPESGMNWVGVRHFWLPFCQVHNLWVSKSSFVNWARYTHTILGRWDDEMNRCSINTNFPIFHVPGLFLNPIFWVWAIQSPSMNLKLTTHNMESSENISQRFCKTVSTYTKCKCFLFMLGFLLPAPVSSIRTSSS